MPSAKKNKSDESGAAVGTRNRIDRRRDAGGRMEVGLPAEGHIKDVFKIGEKRLFMIKEHATYEVKMADTIDPERTNERIPNVQQRIFSVGTSSALLQQVLLTSNVLFNPTYLAKMNCEALAEHALSAMGELLAMDRILERLRGQENGLIEDLKEKELKDGFIVPSLEDAPQDVKNFLQRADHFVREMNHITRIFEPGFRKWERLLQLAEKEDPQNELYVDFLKRSIPYIRFIREARNSVEHPTPAKKVIVYDFELDPQGTIVAPSIEVQHPKLPEPRTRLLVFLDGMIQSLGNLYSAWVAHLCARKAELIGFEVSVMTLPTEKRRYPAAAYSYAIMFKGTWQRID